jgi:hypothetical protein
MIYKLYKTIGSGEPNAVMTVGVEPCRSFLFDPANTDYAEFKKAVTAGAELQDAEGVTMSPDTAKNFVKELP